MSSGTAPTTARLAAIRDLLRHRAVKLGLCDLTAPEADLDAALEALLEREVSVPQPTVGECERWYNTHPEEFVAGEIVLARHILFAVTARTPVDALRRTAEAALLEIGRDPALFEARARELSNCPSGAHGGVLGQLTRGDMVPEFERALFGTRALGVLPTLVNTRFGFHIVAVDRRVAGHRVPFEAVHGEIRARLSRLAWQRALAQYAQLLTRDSESPLLNS
ncbi:MAG TPA: peptidylprolyl isomerase [Casimicrobiaceae bacterium]|nr:peptidylprolyl isomerase [Casimicrobiaceae bacterium]